MHDLVEYFNRYTEVSTELIQSLRTAPLCDKVDLAIIKGDQIEENEARDEVSLRIELIKCLFTAFVAYENELPKKMAEYEECDDYDGDIALAVYHTSILTNTITSTHAHTQ